MKLMDLKKSNNVIHVPVNATTKVYIEPKLVSFVESTGVNVYEEKN